MLYLPYSAILCEVKYLDNEILGIMKQIQKGQKETNFKLDRIEKKLDGVHEQTADLTEFRTEVNLKLDEIRDLENVTKENCFDIAKLKAIK